MQSSKHPERREKYTTKIIYIGLCECNGKYIGDDCSESITIPPSNISLTSNGLCIPGTNDCRNPNIFGNFLTKTIWYNIKYFQVTYENYKKSTSLFNLLLFSKLRAFVNILN